MSSVGLGCVKGRVRVGLRVGLGLGWIMVGLGVGG